ncbi:MULTISPECIES: amino acid adenylation domain-containing protein [unclassified Streptomyces]|uniref:amino acid adenylation domain-containing protein n=1 Tax=unclassified Streptomyces TaxID=2593676 RepID=UPI0036DFFD9F
MTRRNDQVPSEWNDTARPVPALTLAELPQAQAARTPEAVAVVAGSVTLTYRQFDAAVNRLAHRLTAHGATAERFVAVALPRSVDFLVAVHAVVKTGAAYLPVEPGLPDERIRRMIAEADPVCTVTTAETAGRLPRAAAPLLAPGDDLANDGPDNPGPPKVDIRGGHPAYLIYTSGSTGAPKGVVVPHSGIVNRLAWMSAQYPLSSEDRVLHKTPAGFDVSVWELFWPLQNGAALLIARPDGHKDPGYLAELIHEQRITTVHFVPSMLAEFLEHDAARACTGLRRVICSGEPLPAELARRFHARLPGVHLFNLYGPTETSVDVTHWACEPGAATVPIGRPVWNTRMYVLDPDLRPLPPGTAGELYVAGDQLARGYLHQPGLTAQRFRPDPYGPDGSRMYATGDIGRWRADGAIEYVGRADRQVKLRGHRIELGEIEAALAARTGIAQAVVVLSDDKPGGPRLIAYVVPERGAFEGSAALRGHAAEILPDYMVPSVVVPLDRLPLGPNGKLDHAALPAPDTGVDSVAPRDGVEELVAGVWSELLGVQRVGAFDDFFELGGHSLLVTRAVSRLRDVLSVEIPFGTLFEASTVAGVAEVVSDLRRGGGGDVLPAVEPRTGGAVVPLSFAQQRMWFVHQLIPDNPFYNLPAAYRIRGPLDVSALREALSGVVARHEVLRSVFTVNEHGIPESKVHQAGPMELPVEIPAGASEEERVAEAGRLMGRFASQVFDLEHGPVLRAVLVRLGADDHVLAVVVHHLVADGWSGAILNHELGSLYAARLEDRPDPLPPLPVQYGDYALWQRHVFGERELAGQLAYWQQTLRGVEPVLELPTDRTRPAVSTYRGGVRVFALPADVTDKLRELARAERATLFMVLLAAFDVLLVRYTGRTDVLVGTPVANRRRPELEGMVGFFINTLVLRVDCSGAPAFRELLNRVRTATLGAYAHQDVPFEHIVSELGIRRDLRHNPLVQVMFQLQNTPHEQLRLSRTETTLMDLKVPVSTRFDLEVHLQETATGEIEGRLVYDLSLYDPETMRDFAETYRRLLQHVVAKEEG